MRPTAPSKDSQSNGQASLACVILAHTDPVHVHRLIAALDPFPIFLHCDASTATDTFQEMTTGLPDRCIVLERIATGWAKWENVAAELAGYRAALATTSATHIALLTGTDYPLASTTEISSVLARHRLMSIAEVHQLPHPEWRSGGFPRLRYRHWAYRKHMVRLPVPRRLPSEIVYAGGSQLKILARAHVEAVLGAATARPKLVRFWRRSWVADESFIPSVLCTPSLVPRWADEHVNTTPWWIGWDGSRRKSPPWLGMEHWAGLQELTADQASAEKVGAPRLFARKFSTAYSTELLDLIDSQLLTAPDDRP